MIAIHGGRLHVVVGEHSSIVGRGRLDVGWRKQGIQGYDEVRFRPEIIVLGCEYEGETHELAGLDDGPGGLGHDLDAQD